jgi:hypothetical protein
LKSILQTNNNTLRAILSGLKLRDDWDNKSKVSNKYRKSNVPYDVIIRINSLADLRSKGWEIVLGERTENVLLEPKVSEVKSGDKTQNNTSESLVSGIDSHCSQCIQSRENIFT